MISVCHKHEKITSGILGCPDCRKEKFDEIVRSVTEETGREIRAISARHMPSKETGR